MLALQRSINGFDGQISYFTRYNAALLAGPAWRFPDQRRRLRHRPPILYQRHPGRRLVSAQSGAHAPHRLFLQRRTGLCRQYIVGRARRRRSGRSMHRSISPTMSRDRLSRRPVCAGRMESHRQIHHQRRPALRPDVAIRQRQPAQPAHQLHLQAVRVHQVPCRLCALLHAAGAGEAAPVNIGLFSNTTAAVPPTRETTRYAGALNYYDVGVDQNIPFGCSKPAAKIAPTSISVSTPTTRSRTISSTTAFSARPTC